MKSMNKGKNAIIIVMILLLLLILIMGGMYFYLATDIFKTPEQLFKKYMLSNIQEVVQTEIKPFDEITQRSKNEVAEYSLKLDVDTQKLEIEDMEKLDINLALKTDSPNKNEELEILINRDEKEFFKSYLALTNETIGIKVPDLYEKFIAIENRDFKKMAKTFEVPEEYIEVIPDKIPPAFSEEEKDKLTTLLTTKYLIKILDQFEENAYAVEKNIKINVNTTEMLTNKYTFEVSTQKLYTIFTNIISELLDDPEFLELINNRVSAKQLEETKKAYNEFLKENTVDDIEDNIVKIAIYVADGRTIKTEVKTDKGDEFNFSVIKNETESIITSVVITPKSDYNYIGTTTTTTIKNSYTDNTGKLIYETLLTYDKNDIETLQAEHDAEYAEYGSDFKRDYSEIYSDEKNKFTITTKKSNEDTYSGTVKFEGEELDELEEAVDISFKCQLGKASITTISDKNAVVINDYTMEDYTALITEITTNLMNVVSSKPDSLIATIFTSFAEEEEDEYYDSYEDEYNYEEDYTYEDNYDNSDFMNDSEFYSSDEDLKEKFDSDVTYALEMCLTSYKDTIRFNPEANLGDFLNIDKVQEYCGLDYALELLDSTTIKCVANEFGTEYIFYALMNIDAETLSVTEVEVLTEEEYLNR